VSLDTHYRPKGWDDVLGQESTKKVLRRFVASGAGFRQSYLFAGAWGSGKCVTGDTLIPTNKGIVPIKSLMGSVQVEKIDVSVVQETGSVSQAQFSYQGGIRQTIKIITHLGLELEGTPNHRIRVMSDAGTIVWRCLGDLQKGDWVCHPRGGFFGSGADLSDFKYETKGNKGAFKPCPFVPPTTLNSEWGLLLGYLVGDGSNTGDNSVSLTCGDATIRPQMTELIKLLIGSCHNTPDKRTADTGALRSSRKKVRSFLAFAGLSYTKAGDKHVPWSVMVSSKEVVREFLRGYFETDGYVSGSSLEVTSKSERLIKEVQLLLLNLGVVARISPKKKAIPCKDKSYPPRYGVYWFLTVTGPSRALFQSEVGFVSDRKRQVLKQLIAGDFHTHTSRAVTNLREIIPHQEKRLAEFYHNLPVADHSCILNSLFQCMRRGKKSGRMTRRVLEELLKRLPGRPGIGHYAYLQKCDYYYSPVVSIQQGMTEVFDLNVPTGEMFVGNGFMNHNTTLGRILARALLCSNPSPEGDPCDKCESCRSMLEQGVSLNYTEVDAATNSGKEDMRKVLEEIQYASFAGNRRVYLFDESHQLSTGSLDALLKPLEESIPGTEDKKMVCIFCTTEPEKMRATILSRCAPAFVIQPVPPDKIAERLAWICVQEQIPYDAGMLLLIAEATECHIRDALKAIEGVSMLGEITEPNVRAYLHLDLNSLYLDILENIGTDMSAVTSAVHRILERASPVTCYERLVELAMLAYQMTLKVAKPAFFWDAQRLEAIGQKQGENLLGFASRLASRPGRPNASMLLCDLGHLHYVGGAFVGEQPLFRPSVPQVAQNVFSPPPVISAPSLVITTPRETSETLPTKVLENSGILSRVGPSPNYGGVVVSPLAVRTGDRGGAVPNKSQELKFSASEFTPSEFCRLLALRVAELDGEDGGFPRCNNLDST
jgi:DNA polymerase III subunit gamma/tau